MCGVRVPNPTDGHLCTEARLLISGYVVALIDCQIHRLLGYINKTDLSFYVFCE